MTPEELAAHAQGHVYKIVEEQNLRHELTAMRKLVWILLQSMGGQVRISLADLWTTDLCDAALETFHSPESGGFIIRAVTK